MAAVGNHEAPAVHFVARWVARFWKVSTWTPQLPHHFLQLPCRLGGSLTPNQAFCLKRQVFVGFIAGAFLSFRFIFSPLKTRDLRLSGAFRGLIDMAAVGNHEAPAVHFVARRVASVFSSAFEGCPPDPKGPSFRGKACVGTCGGLGARKVKKRRKSEKTLV